MTNIDEAIRRIKISGIIAMIRGSFTATQLIEIANALCVGGVDVLEITLNSPNALTLLTTLQGELGGQMLIGAGTIRNTEQAKEALDAGAKFLVSPNLDLPTATYAKAQAVLYLPGVFTATESATAFAAGCSLVKLFPADAMGPAYLKALRAPLDDVGFVPTGGVTLSNIAEYARAGAVAVGIGGALVSETDSAPQRVQTRAAQFRAAWDAVRHG